MQGGNGFEKKRLQGSGSAGNQQTDNGVKQRPRGRTRVHDSKSMLAISTRFRIENGAHVEIQRLLSLHGGAS